MPVAYEVSVKSTSVDVPMPWPLNLTVRVGCSLAYEVTVPTPVLFVLKPRLEGRVLVMQERLSFGIGLPSNEFQDSHGNITFRSMFMPGRNEICHDALVAVSSLPDSREVLYPIRSIDRLPFEWLRYTLPSRYCDSDKLMNFAWNQFGHVTHGLPRVQAICDWVHANIEYRYLSGRADLSASEVIEHRFGVCRDFAHAAIDLCHVFATIYGKAKLVHFDVWAYQVNPREVTVGDPIDLSKRLDGTPLIRLNG